MNLPKILVTGANGKTGRQVAAQLLAAGYPVRALVRREDARSHGLKLNGAEIVIADQFDPEQLLGAMRGAQRAYFLPPFDAHMMHGAAAFTVAAREARLESVVALSQWLANPSHPALATRQHWLADKLLTMLPATAVTSVNPGFFADMPYMSLLGYAAHLGIFPMPARSSSRDAPPSVDDIARVAVAALIDPARHAGKRYRPTGPEMLSLDDMAQIMGRVLGRTVRHVKLPMWMFYRAARMDGFDPFLLSVMGPFLRDLDRGAFELGGPTDDVLETTGHPPERFETVTRRCASGPLAQRTLGNFIRTVAGFMSVPMRPGFDPARFDRHLLAPRPAHAALSADSALWRREHSVPDTEGSTSPRPGDRPSSTHHRAPQQA